MSENFKKRMIRIETYKPKEVFKHNHNYSAKHLLIVTNMNNLATTGYYLKKEYYYVLKCDQCNSFIPDTIDGNFKHHIFYEKDVNFNFPIITANTMAKNLEYYFSELIDVQVLE